MSGTGSASPPGCGGSIEERRGDYRFAVAVGEVTPPSEAQAIAVVTLALDEDVAGLVPRQDGIGLVVEDVVAAVGADHQHRVPLA